MGAPASSDDKLVTEIALKKNSMLQLCRAHLTKSLIW
jgi:hypothetical protein